MTRDPIGDLERGWTLPFDQIPLGWTGHAREMFTARTGLDPRNMSHAVLTVSTTAPTWIGGRKHVKATTFAWAAGEAGPIAIALPLYRDRRGGPELLAGTVLTCQRQERALALMADGFHVAPIGPRK